MSSVLHDKYRPRLFKHVVGQDRIIESLQKVLKDGSSHSFLFSGPSGVGKTTLARICAKRVGCAARDLIEIDAATHSGVDSMRAVAQSVQYRPLGKGSSKVVIVDEAHGCSKSAWNSALKSLEEPPEHAYWFLCTTEISKVPRTIRTRCTTYSLGLVDKRSLTGLVKQVAESESLGVGGDVIDFIVSEAAGSPRQALVYLATCAGIQSRSQAASLLKIAQESEPMVELCRLLLKGGSWKKAASIIEKLEDKNVESVRIVVSNYMARVAIGTTNEQQLIKVLFILECFSQPFNQSDRLAPLLLSTGRALYGE